VAGVAVIGMGLTSQTVYKVAVYGDNSIAPSMRAFGYWAILAVFLGSLLGAAGALGSSPDRWIRAFAWALPTAAASDEALAIADGRLTFGAPIAIVVAIIASLMFLVGAARSTTMRMAVATLTLFLGGFALFIVVQRLVPIF
jgi:hypothetical protein